jgi:hypothetical protein
MEEKGDDEANIPIRIVITATEEVFGHLNSDFIEKIRDTRSMLFNDRMLGGSVEIIANLVSDDIDEWKDNTNESMGTFTALCKNELSESYIRDKLYGSAGYVGDHRPGRGESNMVIKLYDAREGDWNTLRGIAILNVSEGSMNLLVLGTTPPGLETRGRRDIKDRNDGIVSGRGIHLLKIISYIGAESSITLNALATVISYYWKFGWRFGWCEDGGLKHGGDEAEWKRHIDLLYRAIRRGETDLLEYLTPFTKFASKGYTKAMIEGETREGALELSEGEGFAMVLCPEYNRAYIGKDFGVAGKRCKKTVKREPIKQIRVNRKKCRTKRVRHRKKCRTKRVRHRKKCRTKRVRHRKKCRTKRVRHRKKCRTKRVRHRKSN